MTPNSSPDAAPSQDFQAAEGSQDPEAEVGVTQLHGALDDPASPIQVLDVREPWEVSLVSLPGLIEIPMNLVPDSLNQLEVQRPVWVLCKSGVRSERIAQFLRSEGYQAHNISGGIDAWRTQINPDLPAY